MPDKTELQIKAAEKRLDAIERALETMRKEIQAQSLGTLPQDVKSLKARVDTLDTLVKGLGVQMVLKKDLSTANQLYASERDKEGKALALRMQAEARAIADKIMKENEAQTAKLQSQIDKAVTESRFATLEARLKVLETKK